MDAIIESYYVNYIKTAKWEDIGDYIRIVYGNLNTSLPTKEMYSFFNMYAGILRGECRLMLKKRISLKKKCNYIGKKHNISKGWCLNGVAYTFSSMGKGYKNPSYEFCDACCLNVKADVYKLWNNLGNSFVNEWYSIFLLLCDVLSIHCVTDVQNHIKLIYISLVKPPLLIKDEVVNIFFQ